MVTIPISPLEKLRLDDLPRITQLLDFPGTYPSVPVPLSRAEFAHAFLCVSPWYTDHGLQGALASWLRGAWPAHPRPLQRCGMMRYCHRPVTKQEPAALSLTCPGNRTLQTCSLTAQAGKLSPAPQRCRRSRSTHPTSFPTLSWVSSPTSGLQGGEKPHPIRQGSLRIKASSVMSKAEGRNLVNFII